MRKKSKKNGKNYQSSNGQLVETGELDRPHDSARPFTELDQSILANGRAGSTAGVSSAVRRAGPVQFDERPSWINHGIQLGRSLSWSSPARPFHRIQLDRSPSWTSPIRRTAELDRLESIFTSSS
ncbi:hypothetical protein F2Q70_00021055 [Brassica cretica]|uniref:Uncharacterized protein n=2 Tax=Brassica cretica TaxID=69181 RepID=A0A3N6RVT7_BRACR|nr:hypothetical protein F2Q70_00021055 [Brassica cretica]KAF2559678.1 hypothetical protein F2Q68_00014538 [Brassica cretica]KAF3607362.1 hypothetical protein DY000_02047042 [Brassica cretica]